ncbi:ATP-binding cassette domain-containing protein [Streptomyces laurentii]|uniref:ABC transporter ATP-binding protein n=1 Tax=Streptomyces laurentii TaxID=39478 RepID=UPI0036B50DE6
MRFEGVGRRYGPRGPWVLREVGMDLPAGTLTRVTGVNGTGKSTLLRLAAGLDAPGEGRITGRPARTAYVPERFPAALPLTALGYLVHLGRIQGLDRRTARRRAGEWLERFGAAAHRDARLGELSKGSSQKVAVAQALLAAPGLLVLDEAWTGLDTAARAELDRAVRERTAEGGRVLFVDHDPRRLAGEADAVWRVAAGRVTPVGHEPQRAGPRIHITATGGTALPEGLPTEHVRRDGDRLTVTAEPVRSDVVVRALLDAGWHIDDLRTRTTRTTPTTDDESVRA